MNKSHNLKGIVYRMFNSGQADKIIYIMDLEGSKHILMAKGIKKPNSRKSNSIDLGNYIEAGILDGYQIPIITEIKLLDEFTAFKKNFNNMLFLQLICEVIDKVSLEGYKDDYLFKILYNTLNIKTDRIIYLVSIFLIQVMDRIGNLPQLNRCVITDEEMQADSLYFSQDYIGYISKNALRGSYITASPVPERIAKAQKFIAENSIEKSLRITLTAEEERKMLEIELSWFENIIEVSLKSKAIIFNTILG